MTLLELLELIRRPYIDRLSRAALAFPAHVEPVLRHADGGAAGGGVLGVPTRYDLVRKDTGEAQSVDGTERLAIDPVAIELDGVPVDIAPFSWDWLTLQVAGLSLDESNALMRAWFLHWFDVDDTRAENADGLYGVVHYIGDPESVPGALRFAIDLGSAPAQAVAELIETLLRHGASAVALG